MIVCIRIYNYVYVCVSGHWVHIFVLEELYLYANIVG